MKYLEEMKKKILEGIEHIPEEEKKLAQQYFDSGSFYQLKALTNVLLDEKEAQGNIQNMKYDTTIDALRELDVILDSYIYCTEDDDEDEYFEENDL